MNLLIIDTTKKEAVIQLYYKGVNYTHILPSTQKHNETLLVGIDQLVSKAKCELKDIDAFACVTGPGSFTGIRVGMATISAMAVSLNKPIISGNYFEIVKSYVENGIVLLYSTSSTYYYAKVKNGLIESYNVIENEKLLDLADENEKIFLLSSEQELFNVSYNNIETIKNYNYLMYQYFKIKMEQGDFTKPQSFEPFYIQLSQAERENKKVG